MEQQPLADISFAEVQTELRRLQQIRPDAESWEKYLSQAEKDLQEWRRSSGRAQNYTAEELAEARLFKEKVQQYETENLRSLQDRNGLHQSAIAVAIIESGLAERMIYEGKQGRTFSILEICSRLAPTLTFPGASNYLDIGTVPYNREARVVLGEQPLPHYVSVEAARGSAENMQKRFGSHYVLAETSAAPRTFHREDVAKSRRNPEVHVYSLKGTESRPLKVEFPGVHLRCEFDARVREVLFQQLQRLYS